AVFIFVVYMSFRLDIADYWDAKYNASFIEINDPDNTYTNYYQNEDYRNFRIVWIYIYTLIFLATLSFLNIKKIKNDVLGYVLIVVGVFTFLLFFTEGTFALTELRETYIYGTESEYYNRGISNILIRYIAVFSALTLVYAGFLSVKSGIMKKGL